MLAQVYISGERINVNHEYGLQDEKLKNQLYSYGVFLLRNRIIDKTRKH